MLGAQSVHSGPELGLYVPGAQPAQLPSEPDQPALQTQAATESAPAAEDELKPQAVHALTPGAAAYLPAPHNRHSPAAASALYLPGTHCKQVRCACCSGPPQPTMQTHCIAPGLRASAVVFSGHAVQLEASGAEYVSAGHAKHTSAVAPTAPENVPAAHWTHAPFPMVPLYFPAAHSEHSVFGPAQPTLHAQSATAPLPGSAYE